MSPSEVNCRVVKEMAAYHCRDLLFALQTAGKLEAVHVNLLTGTNMQRRSSAPLSEVEEEVREMGE